MADLSNSETALQGFEPKVLTKANPEPVDLLQARADVQSQPAIRELFILSQTEGWTADQLADRVTTALAKIWPYGDPTEAVQYLVDEYLQFGSEGVFMVSKDTGQVIAIIREEDIYQPAPVPREGGGMATPLKRIRPDLEGAIVTYIHDHGREQKILEGLAAKGYQTQLLREMGDPRLLVATKRGRKHIVDQLATHDPKDLLGATGGTSGAFLRFFKILDSAAEDAVDYSLCPLRGSVVSRSTMGIHDPLTTNLHHNRSATLQGALVQGWVRGIAGVLAKAAHELQDPQNIDVQDLKDQKFDFWIASPDLVRPLLAAHPKAMVMPVEGAPTIAITGQLGYLFLPPEFRAGSREIFDRWETVTEVAYSMRVDLKKIRSFVVDGVETPTQVLIDRKE